MGYRPDSPNRLEYTTIKSACGAIHLQVEPRKESQLLTGGDVPHGSRYKMMKHAFALLALFGGCVPNLFAQANVKIEARDFPVLSARIPFFEKRINAPDAKIRSQVVDEATRLFYVKGKD